MSTGLEQNDTAPTIRVRLNTSSLTEFQYLQIEASELFVLQQSLTRYQVQSVYLLFRLRNFINLVLFSAGIQKCIFS